MFLISLLVAGGARSHCCITLGSPFLAAWGVAMIGAGRKQFIAEWRHGFGPTDGAHTLGVTRIGGSHTAEEIVKRV